MARDVLGIEMRVGVEDQPGKKTQDDEPVTESGRDPADKSPREDQDRHNAQKTGEEIEQITRNEGIRLSGEKFKESEYGDHPPGLDRRTHPAVEFPQAKVCMIQMTQLPRRELEDLGILVAAKMSEVGPTGNDGDAEGKQGASQIESVLKKGSHL